MPIMGRILWGLNDGATNPFGDEKLRHLDRLVRDFRAGRLPLFWRSKVFENRWGDLPPRREDYYQEYYIGEPSLTNQMRVVLGAGGEVFVTWNHYRDFLQVFRLPG